MEQNIPGQRQGVSAALAAAQARAAVVAAVHFPGEDGGRSLADMAQRDLDAALQLLADRAQYITGASGAAIALRRNGRDDMLCRASVGSNAPELGALLSTEFGLSGESVRTRQLLRCDDAERDARVNREVCRQMGIASVLVMPVVNDDQVLGVFELFSGKANAFGERDLSAVQRLSEMVETAVRLAHATENLPEQLSERESSVAEAIHPEVFEGQFLGDLVVEESKEPRDLQSVEAIRASALESPVAAQRFEGFRSQVEQPGQSAQFQRRLAVSGTAAVRRARPSADHRRRPDNLAAGRRRGRLCRHATGLSFSPIRGPESVGQLQRQWHDRGVHACASGRRSPRRLRQHRKHERLAGGLLLGHRSNAGGHFYRQRQDFVWQARAGSRSRCLDRANRRRF